MAQQSKQQQQQQQQQSVLPSEQMGWKYGNPLLSDLMAWELGTLEYNREIALFQSLVDSGMASQLQGMYGRHAQALLLSGEIHAPRSAGTVGM